MAALGFPNMFFRWTNLQPLKYGLVSNFGRLRVFFEPRLGCFVRAVVARWVFNSAEAHRTQLNLQGLFDCPRFPKEDGF